MISDVGSTRSRGRICRAVNSTASSIFTWARLRSFVALSSPSVHRSAAYRSASLSQGQQVHAALAEVTPGYPP